MVSLRPRGARSPSPETELEESRSRSHHAEASRRKRRSVLQSPKERRGRPSPKDSRRRKSTRGQDNEKSPTPLRRTTRRRSSPKGHRRSRSRHEKGRESRRKSAGDLRARGSSRKRKRGSSPSGEDQASPSAEEEVASASAEEIAASASAEEPASPSAEEPASPSAEEPASPKAEERDVDTRRQNARQSAVQSGAVPKRGSRKAEAKTSDMEEADMDGIPIRWPPAGANARASDLGEPNLDEVEVLVPITSSRHRSEHVKNTAEKRNGEVERQRPSEKQEMELQGRETFQERLRRKQMEREMAEKSKGSEVKPAERGEKKIAVAPDMTAMQVAALAIKAAAAAASAEPQDRNDRQEEASQSREKPLTFAERTRRCAERAAALGLSCDFDNGCLMPYDRAKALIQRGRRRRRGEDVGHLDELPPAPCEVPLPPLPPAAEPVDPEKVARAAEAAEAAFSFEAFLAARTRALAAPPKLAPVSQALQQKIEVAAEMRVKKLKRKKRGRDFDYDASLDGESLESSEERAFIDEMDGDSVDSRDEKECLSALSLPFTKSAGSQRTLAGPDIFVSESTHVLA